MVYPRVGWTTMRDASLEAVFFCLLVGLPWLLLHYSALTFTLTVFWALQGLYKVSMYTLLFQWQTQTLHISNPHGPIQSMSPHLSFRWGRLLSCVLLSWFIDWTPWMDPRPDSLPASSRTLNWAFTIAVLALRRCLGLHPAVGHCPACARSTALDPGLLLQICSSSFLMV